MSATVRTILLGVLAMLLISVLFSLGNGRIRVLTVKREPENVIFRDGRAYIDINRADEEMIKSIPGIGDALAGDIIALRDERGGFRDIGELGDVHGLGEEKLKVISEWALAE